MINVRVRYFAVLRERAGRSNETVQSEPVAVRTFVNQLIEDRKLGLPTALIRIAVNGTLVEDDHVLTNGDEVVLIPPVAGG